MRGSPFLQATFIVVLFALTGLPVWRLTRPASAAVAAQKDDASPAADDAGSKTVPLDVEIEFAPAPADFEIKNLEESVLTGRGPQSRFSVLWKATLPPDGVDLVVRAHWSGTAPGSLAQTAGPSAARVMVKFADGRQVEKTFWAAADGTLADVLTVPGFAPPATSP